MADIQLARKVDLDKKADKTQVLTNVPADAKFTDTIYTHPSTHPASMITGLPTKLPADGGNAATVGGFTVEANVPADAKFTDTIYTKLSQLTNDKNFIDGVYDNSTSGLTATTIQGAIDELKSLIDGLTSSE